MIGGNPEDLRRLARQVRSSAGAIRSESKTVREAHGVEWHSSAAAKFRQDLEQRSQEFDQVVERIEDLARKLDKLAQTLEQRQDGLIKMYEQARKDFENAQDAVEDGVQKVWTYAGNMGAWIRDHI